MGQFEAYWVVLRPHRGPGEGVTDPRLGLWVHAEARDRGRTPLLASLRRL